MVATRIALTRIKGKPLRMHIARTSSFKDPAADLAWFEGWASRLEKVNKRQFQRLNVATALGNTRIWGLHTGRPEKESIVIFPGARTSVLFWDLDRNLDHLGTDLNIYLVETNGLPNASDGATPDIKSLDYGHWASEVMEQLKIPHAYVAGASFGGLICMKLAIAHPDKVKAAFLLNPGCLQTFSFSWKNLYYNLLPIFFPKRKNIEAFLDKAIFCKPNHQLSREAWELIVDYEHFALTRYKDKTQKPYDMESELREVKIDTYLLEGNQDLLFPYETSIQNAEDRISTLVEVKVFENVGHGIETYGPALEYVREVIWKRGLVLV